jgi:hypothetical protein
LLRFIKTEMECGIKEERKLQNSWDVYFNELKLGKRQDIYDLIEEVVEVEPKKELKEKKKKNPKYKNSKLFEGRNIIKKVKTHCLKIFYKTIKECIEMKEKVSPNFRLKIYEKKNIYKIFKSDISKFRNKILLNIKMKKIIKVFSNINIHDNSNVKEEKRILFNFLMNCTWMDILLYVKRGNPDILAYYKNKPLKNADVASKEVNEYMDYIKNGTNNYKDRINLDRNYLDLYENLVTEYKFSKDLQKKDILYTEHAEVKEFIKNFTLLT